MRARASSRRSTLAATFASLASGRAYGASSVGAAEWLPWLILGAVGVFVVGVLLRMFLAARFPKGYRTWARSRRDEFAQRNDAWDRADDEFRK